MYFIITLSLLLSACASRSPATTTIVPNPFYNEAPAGETPATVTPNEDDAAEEPDDGAEKDVFPENNPDLIELPEPTGGSTTMTVTSWNVQHLGRKSFDLRDNNLLDNADIITFQEVNSSDTGPEALRLIKVGIEQRTKHKMCYALSERPSGAQEIYGYIWRNDRIAFIKRTGKVKFNCGKNADKIPLGTKNKDRIVREPAVFRAVFKPQSLPFVLASIHLLPTGRGKRPELEVEPLFDTFREAKIPVIVAGDFNLAPTPPPSRGDPFAVARQMGYAAALIGVKTSIKTTERTYSKPYDNFWSKGFELQGIGVIDILEIFKDVELATLRKTISDHAPISAGFTFR